MSQYTYSIPTKYLDSIDAIVTNAGAPWRRSLVVGEALAIGLAELERRYPARDALIEELAQPVLPGNITDDATLAELGISPGGVAINPFEGE